MKWVDCEVENKECNISIIIQDDDDMGLSLGQSQGQGLGQELGQQLRWT